MPQHGVIVCLSRAQTWRWMHNDNHSSGTLNLPEAPACWLLPVQPTVAKQNQAKVVDRKKAKSAQWEPWCKILKLDLLLKESIVLNNKLFQFVINCDWKLRKIKLATSEYSFSVMTQLLGFSSFRNSWTFQLYLSWVHNFWSDFWKHWKKTSIHNCYVRKYTNNFSIIVPYLEHSASQLG